MDAPDDFAPKVGDPVTLLPGLQRILAPNPSPMTYRGTNTYLLGQDALAVIDPGPDDEAHLQAILRAARGRVSHILVTHAHLDHSPLARALAQETGAPVYAFGPATAGRSTVMQELAASGLVEGGEGVDVGFEPDETLADGEVLQGYGWTLRAIHTPGHMGNHLCLAWDDRCFTADHVMGWASSLVSPPDGDLTDFMASCRKLQERTWSEFFPGHGAPIADTGGRLDWLINHRLSREASILETLRSGAQTARSLAEAIYVDTPALMLTAATRNVLAHLVDLYGRELVDCQGPLAADARFIRLT